MNAWTLALWAVLALFFSGHLADAKMPTNPVTDSDFLVLPDGKDLRALSVSGSRLSLARGSGRRFSSSERSAYLKLKNETQTNPAHPVQWVFMDLDKHLVLEQSLSPNRKIFGASSSKIFVGGALLDRQNSHVSSLQLQLMAEMLVVSSNEAWTELQSQVGSGDDDKGRERIHAFTQRMGYERTRGFQGNWKDLHGNELTATETTEFLYDTYQGHYPGAETLWKLMHTCRTGAERGRKYLPTSVFVGGKTGTYSGRSVDPETGKDKNPDGSPYKVSVKNHVLVFNVEGHQYGLTVLAADGSDESAALLAAGLLEGRPYRLR